MFFVFFKFVFFRKYPTKKSFRGESVRGQERDEQRAERSAAMDATLKEKVRAGEVDIYGKKRNPFVIVGAFATAGVLFAGIAAFRRGNQAMSQNMMKARVMCQGLTVGLMVATSGLIGSDTQVLGNTLDAIWGKTETNPDNKLGDKK